MDSCIVQTEKLCKKFGKQHVVNNISLMVKRNSIYWLLGTNGAGKSTTLKYTVVNYSLEWVNYK